MDRRKFLTVAGASVASSALLSGQPAAATMAPSGEAVTLANFNIFSKHLQFLDYQEMAETARSLGFTGIDLSVRKGGHVEPENFERDLPAAIAAIKQAGLKCEMMVTKIVGTDNRRDYDILSLAQSLGIKSYRLGALNYDKDVHPMTSVDQHKARLEALAQWNRDIGITGMYQNHSGELRFGASIWDLYLVLKDLDPDYMGCQFDLRHAVVEGGKMWPDTYRLIQPYIRSLALKDFKWAKVKGSWRLMSTPIGEGMVEFDRYFSLLKKDGVNYPVSMHYEYDLGGASKGRRELTIPKSEVLAAMKRDVIKINKIWDAA